MSLVISGPVHPPPIPGVSSRSQARRAFEVLAFVGVWVALGFALRWGVTGYLLLGVPLTLTFQVLVARRPLTALWLREASFRFSWPAAGLAALLAAAPIWKLVEDAGARRWMEVSWSLAAVAGAVPAAFAMTRLQRSGLGWLALCFATAGTIGVTIVAASALAARLTGATSGHEVALALRLRTGAIDFLCFVPVTFVLEEVSFRGALDAHVHREGDRRGSLSAIFVAALWGLWHLPVVAERAPMSAPVALSLVIVHTLIGVPFSLCWRRSGNLAVPGLVHAFIDGFRDAALLR